MRCGFMDEFYSVSRVASSASWGLTPLGSQIRPVRASTGVPSGRWHLTVMNFRRNAKVERNDLKKWIEEERRSLGLRTGASDTGPQSLVSLLCRSMNASLGTSVTPVELDDFLMWLAADTVATLDPGMGTCHDESPECSRCALRDVCQANNDPGASALTGYIT